MNTKDVSEFILSHKHVRCVYLVARFLSNAAFRLNPFQWFSRRVLNLEYLNVGCERKFWPHTVNLDYSWFPGIDLTADIRKRLPVADNRFKGIFCEHVLEHLTLDKAALFLSECLRLLRPGGRIRFIVPDAELYLRTYCHIKDGENVRFPYHSSELTPMMQVNLIFSAYENGHQFAYDFETLAHLLQTAGFKNIELCDYKQGNDENLLLDSDYRQVESFRIEASK